jgi:hypothetical protein
MASFKIQEVRGLEAASTNPTQLKTKVGDMILSSTDVHAKVESLNDETGEYRLVLQGTLHKEGLKL